MRKRTLLEATVRQSTAMRPKCASGWAKRARMAAMRPSEAARKTLGLTMYGELPLQGPGPWARAVRTLKHALTWHCPGEKKASEWQKELEIPKLRKPQRMFPR